MDEKRFLDIVNGFDKVRIAVVGDIFLDRIFYIDRKLDEPSVETGLTAYQVARRSGVPGAAGVVTNNLSALRVGEIYALALTGNDGEGFDLKKGLRETNVDTDYMVSDDSIFTPTYTKTFFDYEDRMEETHRIDIKNRRQTSRKTEERIIANLKALEDKVDAFVCLEQIPNGACGVFTPRVIETLAEIGKNGKAGVFVDSRFHIADFHDVIVKCNDLEILRSAGFKVQEGEAHWRSVEDAMKQAGKDTSRPMFISCGELGMKVYTEGEVKTIRAFRVEGPVDICGAGDSALTGIACALCAGASLEEAALTGNLVASIIVEQIGVTGTATREKLIKRFQEYQERR